jgi:preprotein translocase subunit SecE
MAKANTDVTFWQSQGSIKPYKRNQGKLTRQLTALAIAVILIIGAYQFSQFLASGGLGTTISRLGPAFTLGVPLVVGLIGTWFAYRLINWPRFADFLIAVEAEMDKVTWPSRQDLQRATIVVIVTMLFIGAVLFFYDIFWAWFFTLIRILKPAI